MLTLTTSILITVNNTYFRKRAAINDIAYSIQEFNANLYRLINLGLEIDNEIRNDQFDKSLFDQQWSLFRTLQIELDNLQCAANITKIDMNDNIAALVIELKKYKGQREEIEGLHQVKEENAINNQKPNTNTAQELKEHSTYMEAYSKAISAKILFAKKKIYKELRFYYLCITIGIIFLALAGGTILSISVSKPLKSFSSYISGFVSSNFKLNNLMVFKNTYLELKNISDKFNLLTHELFEHEKQRDEAIRTLEIERTQYKQLTELLPLSIFETDITWQLVCYNNSFRKKIRIRDKQNVYYLKDFIKINKDCYTTGC